MPKVDLTHPTFIDAYYAAEFRTRETGVEHQPMYVSLQGSEWRADSTALLGGLVAKARTRYDAAANLMTQIDHCRDNAVRVKLA